MTTLQLAEKSMITRLLDIDLSQLIEIIKSVATSYDDESTIIFDSATKIAEKKMSEEEFLTLMSELEC